MYVLLNQGRGYPFPLCLFHLEEMQFYRGKPAEDAHHHTELAMFYVHFLYGAGEVRKGSIDNAHRLTGFVLRLAICWIICSTSSSGMGMGLVPPTNPVTRGTLRTKCQVSSSRDISIRI
jgi:hypothetical protein